LLPVCAPLRAEIRVKSSATSTEVIDDSGRLLPRHEICSTAVVETSVEHV
jgi:hypothetical protein